jgi:hypothetical protein
MLSLSKHEGNPKRQPRWRHARLRTMITDLTQKSHYETLNTNRRTAIFVAAHAIDQNAADLGGAAGRRRIPHSLRIGPTDEKGKAWRQQLFRPK